MDYVQRFQIANLQLELHVIWYNWTWLGTGLSLARGSGNCCDFTAAFLFNGITDFVKDWIDNDIWCHIFANCRRGGGGGVGGEVVLWYFQTNVGGGNFFGFKILKFSFFGFLEKWIFFGYEDFVDIFGGSSQYLTVFRGHFYAFLGLFLRSMYRVGVFIYFFFWGGGGCYNFKYFGVFLKFLFFLFVCLFFCFFFGGGVR